MRSKAWILLIFATFALGAPASAQVTVSDGVARPTRWMLCHVRPNYRPDLPYYHSPIVERDSATRDQLVRALWPYWENGGSTGNPMAATMNYNAPDCADYFKTRAEAEAALQSWKSQHASSVEVGAGVIRAAEEARQQAIEETEIARLAAEETNRLGAHRAAEAERIVRLRRAAERARQKSACPLSPQAKVKCM